MTAYTYVSRNALLSDVCQMAAYQCAFNMVKERGYFRISHVVREAKLMASQSVILWKRIVQLIERNLNVRLIPVSTAFFQGRSDRQALLFPGAKPDPRPQRYLATGRREIAGYISAGMVEAEPVIRLKSDRLHKIGEGFERSSVDILDRQDRAQQARLT